MTDNIVTIRNLNSLRNHHAVVEHYINVPNAPPRCIFVGVCKLRDVYDFHYSRRNHRWLEIMGDHPAFMVRILHVTTNFAEASHVCSERLKQHNPPPECNMVGAHSVRHARAIRNVYTGETYRSQQHAAQSLGVTQSAVSQHLCGRVTLCGGTVLEYDNSYVPALVKMSDDAEPVVIPRMVREFGDGR